MQPTLPAGCRVRAATVDDAEVIAELQNSVFLDTTGVTYSSTEDVERHLTAPDVSLPDDVCVVEEEDRVVGMAVVHARAPYDRISIDGFVRPTERGRGIGTFLLEWGERRARVMAAEHPTAAPPLLEHWVGETDDTTRVFLESNGYAPERWFHHMEMDLADPVPDLPVADGLTIRTVNPGEEWQVGQASDEAFKDHFGHTPTTEERWNHYMVDRPDFDASLWFIGVTEDGTIAGTSLNFIHSDRGTPCGLVDDLSVRRPWRRQGLGAALLAAGLRAFQERGLANAELFVDSENPTGALGVYERAGMSVARSFALMSKTGTSPAQP